MFGNQLQSLCRNIPSTTHNASKLLWKCDRDLFIEYVLVAIPSIIVLLLKMVERNLGYVVILLFQTIHMCQDERNVEQFQSKTWFKLQASANKSLSIPAIEGCLHKPCSESWILGEVENKSACSSPYSSCRYL